MTVGELIDALAREDRASEVLAADAFGSMRTPIDHVRTAMWLGEPTRVLLILDA